jgi:hypothetical protein
MGGGANNPPPKGNVTFSVASRGDIEAGFREADQIIEYDFNMPRSAATCPYRRHRSPTGMTTHGMIRKGKVCA